MSIIKEDGTVIATKDRRKIVKENEMELEAKAKLGNMVSIYSEKVDLDVNENFNKAKSTLKDNNKKIDKGLEKIQKDYRKGPMVGRTMDECSYNAGQVKAILNEYFDTNNSDTRRKLLAMTEVEHNSTLTNLTSKLYDKIVSKAHNIDYGEIPKTKGDITKLSNFEEMKETLGIIKDIIKEYKQDPTPVDEISVAIGNIQGHKDMFERAFRYDCEMPMLMYNNMVLAVITGTSYMISSCIEFIKAPKDESFSIQLDKISYIKSKDHLIYQSIGKFNKACKSGEFDSAMNMIIDKKIKRFTGVTVAAGIATGIIILITIIPILRELTYLFFHCKASISDYFGMQADLLTMNAYNVQNNKNIEEYKREEISKKQMDIATKFRDISNKLNIDSKQAEVKATRDIKQVGKTYELDDNNDVVAVDDNNSEDSSVLF